MIRIIIHCLHIIKGCIIIFCYFLLVFPCRLFLGHRRLWIISEHGYEARDNGYTFFKYLRENHSDINCYYAIDYSSSDFDKVARFGNVIRFGSLKHFIFFCGAKYIISSKTQGFCPSGYLEIARKKMHLCGTFVFLQHGITKDNQLFLHRKKSKIDLFICGAKPEYDDISKKYGYKKNQVVYTGFSRFDSYINSQSKHQILLMPTWRRYVMKSDFISTEFYLAWSNFINSSELNDVLNNHSVDLIFYLHPQLKDFDVFFKSSGSKINIVRFDECNLQELIKNSGMFITDFSSLAFDFAYMNKPVIYYQFDERRYFKEHYFKGYFDYRKNGFGPVYNQLNEVIKYLAYILEKNFNMEDRYRKNSDLFFPLRDNKNSERIFNAIVNYRKKQ